MPREITEEWISKKTQELADEIWNDNGQSSHNLLDDKIRKYLTEAVEQERENLKRDMLVKMKEWHGTGTAMVNDYFKALITKADDK